MNKKYKKTCGRCKYLFTRYGKKGGCFFDGKSKGISNKACKEYKEGIPLVPTFKGKKAKIIELKDPSKPEAFVIQTSDKQILALLWETEKDSYGYWRIKQLGISDKCGPILNQFSPEQEDTAFYGEVAVVGALKSELWRSDGYEDDNVIDEEGNIVNKPIEIRVYPRRYEE